MRRPWQVWLIFSLCSLIVIPAMIWLTGAAAQLDRQQLVARRQAELEEVVGNMLWQMDAELTRWIAPETARPFFLYRSFYLLGDGADGSQQPSPSPLLVQPPEYVRVHFHIHPDGTWASPQCPEAHQQELAISWGVDVAALQTYSDRLEELKASLELDVILAQLPQQILPDLATGLGPSSMTDGSVAMKSRLLINRSVDSSIRNSMQFAAQQPEAQQQQEDVESYSGQVAQTAQRLRVGENLDARNNAFQAVAKQQALDQRRAYGAPPAAPVPVVEGVPEIFWHDGRLLMARYIDYGGEMHLQGCWLDWEKIRTRLLELAQAHVPHVALEPAIDLSLTRANRVLAALPVQLVVPEAQISQMPWTPLRWALLVAWVVLSLSALSAALLLHGVVTLSERRAAFVSAVTHELRTPLTTFRLYSEMLAEGMVSDEQQRMTYLDTLRREAERLSHLVENVLQYARLERGVARDRLQELDLPRLLEHALPALERRAELADMQIVVEKPPDAAELLVRTDPEIVEQILFNLVDNACKYAAAARDPRIHVRISVQQPWVDVQISDHGPGISEREGRRLFRPFRKTAEEAAESSPGVGLGLSLCRRLARQIGGRLAWMPGNGGACFVLSLPQVSDD